MLETTEFHKGKSARLGQIDRKMIDVTKIVLNTTKFKSLEIIKSADNILKLYYENYTKYEFELFWENHIVNKYTSKECQVILHHILIHATQNVNFSELMLFYDDIKKFLDNNEMHPDYIDLIKEHVIYIPEDIKFESLYTWITSRKEVFENQEDLKDHYIGEKILMQIVDENLRSLIKMNFTKSELGIESESVINAYNLLKSIDGVPPWGSQMFLVLVARLVYDEYLDKHDGNGNIIPFKTFVMDFGAWLGVSLSTYDNSYSRGKEYEWYLLVQEKIRQNKKRGPKIKA